VDQKRNTLSDPPSPVNPAAFMTHSCIHGGRPDVGCVLHTHSRAGVAVSAQKCGILPISQQSTFVLPQLAYHDYEGVALREDEQPRLQADLGDKNFLMLRNHGLLTVGPTVADAFLAMYVFESTCAIQISAQAGGELVLVDPKILATMSQVIKMVTAAQGANIAWPALLRKLDRVDASYKD
jgi:ribulose-5-phosphate 4-epimerase/fuculose-1-phosphate aldolase